MSKIKDYIINLEIDDTDAEYQIAMNWYEDFVHNDRPLYESDNQLVVPAHWSDFDKDDVIVQSYPLSDFEGWQDYFHDILLKQIKN